MRYQKLRDEIQSIDLVQITFTQEEYSEFLFLMDYWYSSAARVFEDDDLYFRKKLIRLLNKMNEGNLDWLAYKE